MRKEEVIDTIACKLFSEGVLAKNYDRFKALLILRHCVMPRKLMYYLIENEIAVMMRLGYLSQIKQINATESLPYIKQQFTAKLMENMEDCPQEFSQIVSDNLFDLI